jgi:hypothetical protein
MMVRATVVGKEGRDGRGRRLAIVAVADGIVVRARFSRAMLGNPLCP